MVGADSFFTAAAAGHLGDAPCDSAVYDGREFAETGGLMDYGTKVTEVYRQLGVKGAKPADLPVVQSSKFELVINAQAARNRRPPTSDSVGIAESELSRSLVVRASSD